MSVRRTAVLAVAALAAAAGCTTTRTRAPFPAQPIHDAPRRSARLAAAVLPLGSVPYDTRSLPLVSPDGRVVVTQVGFAPDWTTLLAQPGALPADDSFLEGYRLDRVEGEAILEWSSVPGLLLGRSGDLEGFLVESPRPGGARWIGRIAWGGGPITWLVADDHVNAFACRGDGDRLAWSRRPTDGDRFDLVIRRSGDQWTLGAQGGDWLLPVWGAADELFAFRLEDGRLEAVHMSAASADETRDSLQRLRLADGRDVPDAYQCLASVAAVSGTPTFAPGALLFWHPTSRRMAAWRPAPSPAAADLLEPDTIAAAADDSGLVLMATEERLLSRSPSNPADRRTLLMGTFVPRRVSAPGWPYLLLSPRADRIDLTAMKLVE